MGLLCVPFNFAISQQEVETTELERIDLFTYPDSLGQQANLVISLWSCGGQESSRRSTVLSITREKRACLSVRRTPSHPRSKQPSAVIPFRNSAIGLGPNTRIQNSMRHQLSRNGQSPPMGPLSLFLFKVIMKCHKRKQLESTMASWYEWTNRGKPLSLLPPSQLSFHHKAECPSDAEALIYYFMTWFPNTLRIHLYYHYYYFALLLCIVTSLKSTNTASSKKLRTNPSGSSRP